MIPVQLTLEGLYSYQNRQIIDFNALTEAGLFGIFGAVGSGKSSILEAITFALYGETERLNARDKRAYNMMNLKSNRSYIEFDFLNHEEKLFRVTREFKRNSKRFEDVKSPIVVFYEWIENEWKPLSHSNAFEIIGLSYENFKRTIIIPQGQFKEFIELGAKDRTQMMKEIFNLHRFDLQDKVSFLNKSNQTSIDQLDGKLSGFETVSEEHINELKIQMEELALAANKVQKEFIVENEKFQQLKALKADFENLTQKKISFAKLVELQPQIQTKQQQLSQYELYYNLFHQLLLDQKKLSSEIDEKSSVINQHLKQLALLENEIATITKKIDVIQHEFEALPIKRKEETDLELIIQILVYTKEIEELKQRTLNGQLAVEQVKAKEQEITDLIKIAEAEVQKLVGSKIDAQLLMDVDNWYNKNQSFIENKEKQVLKITQIKQKISEINQQLIDQNIEGNRFEDFFEKEILALDTKKKIIEKQKSDVEIQQRLDEFATHLHDGEACPLCGSLEHPKPKESGDVKAKIIIFEKQIKTLENDQKILLQQKSNVQQIINQKDFLETQIKQENYNLETIEAEFSIHFSKFVWKEFTPNQPDDFVAKKNASILVDKTIQIHQKSINDLRNVLENERLNLDKYQKKLEEFKANEVEKATQINQNKANLKILKFENFQDESTESLVIKLSDLKNKNQKTEEDFALFTEQLNAYKLNYTAQKSSIDVSQKYLAELQLSLKNVNKNLDKNLKDNLINTLDDVVQILALRLNVVEVRKEIDTFRINYQTVKNSIEELEQKFNAITFDDSIFRSQELKLNEILKRLNEANDKVATTKAEVDRLTKAFDEKKELLVTMEALQKRATNLQTLRNLFNSAGFVQYVSSIYLKQLCENANIRFHRMTRNQLSLQINENNDFEIIDFLNEGRPRSVKTLSGGQSFQVSLSLALALAESVQTNAKSDKNFFFIDEGFGTQDADAVNIVFETLNHLHKENRIVGVISHVEELKERIPVALNVVKDEESGSKITIV